MSDGGMVPDNDPPLAELAGNARAEFFPFDPSLEGLVMFINLLDSTEIGVTLHVKGMVVSGLLISAHSFFNLMVKELDQAADDSPNPEISGARIFANFYRSSLETHQRARDEYLSSEKLPPRPHHLHLRQAKSFTLGDPLVQSTWRCRITEIDAWSLGHFGEHIPPLPAEMRV